MGFFFLGMGIYNGVWEHLYRRYVKGEVGTDTSKLVPGGDRDGQLPIDSENFSSGKVRYGAVNED